jgi:ribonuclease HII
LARRGFKYIVGLDEVGRGSWAGPLVACAVKLPKDHKLYKLRDSKLLFYLERERLAKALKKICDFGLGIVKVDELNGMNLHQANLLAYERAVAKLRSKIDFILIDGFRAPNLDYPHKAIIDGDRICASIAAASIIAKDFRDKMMIRLAKKYSKWGFEKHKGYGTKFHQAMLVKHGISEIHRLRFKPIRAFI